MFFKNLLIYRFNRPIPFTQQELADHLQAHRFVGCQAQDAFRLGWAPCAPAVDGEALTFDQGQFTLLALRREDKILPGSVVKEAVEQRVAEIELREQRRVAGREKTDLKTQLTAELLPRAFARSRLTFAYIDFARGLLMLDTASGTKADEFTSFLRQCVGSLPIQFVALQVSPVATLTRWVADNQAPQGFVLADQCELRAGDATDTVIRCKGSESLHDAVATHIDNGLAVTELALVWEDKLKLTVNEGLQIKRIKPLDIGNDRDGGKDRDAADRFTGNLSLMTLEFGLLFEALTTALGGEDTSQVDQRA